MLKIIAVSALLMVGFIQVGNTQDKPRKSPTQTVNGSIDGTNVIVSYGSPSVKGRTIWGELVPYGKVWRTGANEATTIELHGDVMIEGKEVKEGKYSLFTIPNKESWTIILNSVPDQWGAYKYDESKDVARVSVKPREGKMNEMLTMVIKNNELIIKWDKLEVPIKLAKVQ